MIGTIESLGRDSRRKSALRVDGPQPRLLDPALGEPISHATTQCVHQIFVRVLRVRRLIEPVTA
jgi:hypothetical protein